MNHSYILYPSGNGGTYNTNGPITIGAGGNAAGGIVGDYGDIAAETTRSPATETDLLRDEVSRLRTEVNELRAELDNLKTWLSQQVSHGPRKIGYYEET